MIAADSLITHNYFNRKDMELNYLPIPLRRVVRELVDNHGLKFPFSCETCQFLNNKNIATCEMCESSNPSYSADIASSILERYRELPVDRSASIQRLGRHKKKLIAVLHFIVDHSVTIQDRAVSQARLAFENGADGVMCIIGEQPFSVSEFLSCYRSVRLAFPEKFVGLNFLSSADVVIENLPQVLDADALWMDSGVHGKGVHQPYVSSIQRALKDFKFSGLHFGGFFFKGSNQTLPLSQERLCEFATLARRSFDILTTSGVCTGVPIDRNQLERIAQSVDSKTSLLALASGVDEGNIDSFLPFVDYFLIGSGIEEIATDTRIIAFYQDAGIGLPRNVGCLDPSAITRIATKIHAYNNEDTDTYADDTVTSTVS